MLEGNGFPAGVAAFGEARLSSMRRCRSSCEIDAAAVVSRPVYGASEHFTTKDTSRVLVSAIRHRSKEKSKDL